MGRSDHQPFIMPWRGIGPRIADDAFIAPTASVIGDAEIEEFFDKLSAAAADFKVEEAG